MDFGCEEIYCISLVDRTDKRKYFSDLMKELNIPFKFFDAIRDKKIPSRGCFRSHFKIISDAYKNNVQRLMIFEDDVCVRDNISKPEIKTIRRFLDKNTDWDLFYLGHVPKVWSDVVKKVPHYKNIYKGHFLCTHAYIINRRGIEKYRDVKWGKPHKAIDGHVFCNDKAGYGPLPDLYRQRPVTNDIGKNSVSFMKFRTSLANFALWYAQNINIRLYTVFGVIIMFVVAVILYKKNTRRE